MTHTAGRPGRLRVEGVVQADDPRADGFDALIRVAAREPSRRGFLRLLLGTSLGSGLASILAPLTGRAGSSVGPIDPTTGLPLYECTPSCGPCHVCRHAYSDEPYCMPTCGACSFCNADDETCVSSCSECETCKAGECQSTCPDCQACEDGTCRDCGTKPCERCEGGLCVGCQPNCEHCDPFTNTCQTTCAGGQTCCAGMCAGCCGPCNHATGTCRDWQDNLCMGDDRTCCPDGCWELGSDFDHCGACAHRCQPWEVCCDGVCIDPADDNLNCGACGRACDGDYTCCQGECVSPQVAASRGMACCPGNRRCGETCCPKGQSCKNGVCECLGSQQACVDDQGDELCCGQGERCCNNQCIPFNDGCCPPGEHVARECGGCCPNGEVCNAGVCEPLVCDYPDNSCYDENGPTLCCGLGMLCDDDNTCQPECYGGICRSPNECCDSIQGCAYPGECCPVGSYRTGNQPGHGPTCCPDDTQACCCECRPFDQGCFCDPC